MPLGQSQDIPQADPGGRVTPQFRHRLIRFRHFIDGSLALASLNLACRDHVPTFPQRSPPSLLTTAARGGLRPAPDCRPRRALLHLSYSSAPLYADDAFVTHDPLRSFGAEPGTPLVNLDLVSQPMAVWRARRHDIRRSQRNDGRTASCMRWPSTPDAPARAKREKF